MILDTSSLNKLYRLRIELLEEGRKKGFVAENTALYKLLTILINANEKQKSRVDL